MHKILFFCTVFLGLTGSLWSQTGLDTFAFYENPEMPTEILFPFEKKGKYGYCTYAGKQKCPAKMKKAYPEPLFQRDGNMVYLIVEDEKVGLIGPDWKLKPRIQKIYNQGDAHWFVYNKKGKAGWLNIWDGKFLTGQKYDDLFYLQDGLVLARIAEKYGLLVQPSIETGNVRVLVPIAADSIWMAFEPTRQVFCQYGENIVAYDYDSQTKDIALNEKAGNGRSSKHRYFDPLWARKEVRDRLIVEEHEPVMEETLEEERTVPQVDTVPVVSYQDQAFESLASAIVEGDAGKKLVNDALARVPKVEESGTKGRSFWKAVVVNDSISVLYLYLPYYFKVPVLYFHRPDYRLLKVVEEARTYFDNGEEIDFFEVSSSSKLRKLYSFPSSSEILDFSSGDFSGTFLRFEGEDYFLINNSNFGQGRYTGRFKFPKPLESVVPKKYTYNGFFRLRFAGEKRERMFKFMGRSMLLTEPLMERDKTYDTVAFRWFRKNGGKGRFYDAYSIVELSEKGEAVRFFRPDGSEIRPR